MSARYADVRAATMGVTEPLAYDDYLIQSAPFVSPPKWHLGHTTWFFEQFVLAPHVPGYRPYHPRFGYIFNSYYDAVGERVERSRRGVLSRPTGDEVRAYRRFVDEAMAQWLDTDPLEGRDLVELGLQHEQQHQELLLMDIKHNAYANPLRPPYGDIPWESPRAAEGPGRWYAVEGGVVEVGHPGVGFGFDNEMPRHRVYLEPFALFDRLVTNGEYLKFIEDGGYRTSRHWLSDGWDRVRAEGWEAPLYWERHGASWSVFTLSGDGPLDPDQPVSHVSFFEADAYSRWAGARLPTEAEWEWAASRLPTWDAGRLWEWTASSYLAYPGFRPRAGAVGEYNGKFMSGQMVLRGGCVATPPGHCRPSYRNFFPPDSRWQFSGIRLASEVNRA